MGCRQVSSQLFLHYLYMSMWRTTVLLLALSSTLLTATSSASPAVALVVEAEEVPAGYDLIGVYLVESVSRHRGGRTTTIPLRDTRYRVYSNGQKLRVYQADVEGTFHSYDIYRSDGISSEDAHGNISVVPGLQAKLTDSGSIKQLSISQGSLTMTQFPPISDTVIITFAKRLEPVSTNR